MTSTYLSFKEGCSSDSTVETRPEQVSNNKYLPRESKTIFPAANSPNREVSLVASRTFHPSPNSAQAPATKEALNVEILYCSSLI